MSGFIYEAANSEDNCYHSDLGEIIDHKIDEIYTCLDCLEDLTRQSERGRIVKLLEDRVNWLLDQDNFMQIAEAESWLRAIALIKGENK